MAQGLQFDRRESLVKIMLHGIHRGLIQRVHIDRADDPSRVFLHQIQCDIVVLITQHRLLNIKAVHLRDQLFSGNAHVRPAAGITDMGVSVYDLHFTAPSLSARLTIRPAKMLESIMKITTPTTV